MKVKTKLIASIMSICLVCAVFAIGVFALKTANLKIGGDVSFSATGVEVSIKNGNIIGADVSANNTAFVMAPETDELKITTSMTQTDIDNTFSKWRNLDLKFKDSAEDIIISFDIRNENTDANNYIEIDYDYTFNKQNPNVVVLSGKDESGNWVANNLILAPKGVEPSSVSYQTFYLVVRVVDKELDVPSDLQLSLDFKLKHFNPSVGDLNEDQTKLTTEDGIIYTLNKTYKTASLGYSDGGGMAPPTGDNYSYAQKDFNIAPVVADNAGNKYVVTEIGQYAFTSMVGGGNATIENIVIPNSVTTIGSSAINACPNITALTIPISVTTIGQNGIFCCVNMGTIVVKGGNGVYDSRNNCNAIIETKTNKLIKGCYNTIIPYGIVAIGDSAFATTYVQADNSKLTSIVIPDSVTTIGNSAFSLCAKLATVTMPKQLTTLGNNAFENCRELETIVIPNGVTEIRSEAFTGCSKLKSVELPDGLIELSRAAFMNSGLLSITIPKSITTIAADAFNNCNDLDIIKIDSQTIVAGLTGPSYLGSATSYATSIYIKSDLDVTGATYLANTANYTPEKIGNTVADADGDGYILYTKVV